ncbi:MAG: hypothetical protein IPK19_16455 [Chloroflexi bacterium]|nr:hypothetical protein [Chloroflexota bacterium]
MFARKTQILSLMLLAASVAAVLLISPISAQDETAGVNWTVSPVRTHPSQGDVREVEGAQAELFTSEEGVTMNFRTTELEAGHVYTAWWVIVNNPENCEASPCAPAQVLGDPATLGSEVTFADGLLVDEAGRMEFAASLAAGEVP